MKRGYEPIGYEFTVEICVHTYAKCSHWEKYVDFAMSVLCYDILNTFVWTFKIIKIWYINHVYTYCIKCLSDNISYKVFKNYVMQKELNYLLLLFYFWEKGSI